MGLKPRRGAIAFNEKGLLGLIKYDQATMPEAGSSSGGAVLWEGLTLTMDPVGTYWSSKNPRVLAYVDELFGVAQYPSETNPVRCSTCDGTFTWDQALVTKSCPRCGTTTAPESPQNDIIVKINWEEARLVSLFAHNWVTQAKLPSVFHVRLERLFRKFRGSRPQGTMALLDHEIAEEAALEESMKSFATRLSETRGGKMTTN